MIIDYPSSPTLKAYIGKAQEPLMPNDNGIGFRGVLLQDDRHLKVQCSSCGQWFYAIGSAHLMKCCGLTSLQYKEKYGLYKGQGLVSDTFSQKLAKAGIRALRYRRLIAPKLTSAKASHMRTSTTKWRYSPQWENDNGTCPEQIKDRLKKFILDNKEMPTPLNKGGAIVRLLQRRFETVNDGFWYYGLPIRKKAGRYGMMVTFPGEEPYKIDLLDEKEREDYYNKIIALPFFNEVELSHN